MVDNFTVQHYSNTIKAYKDSNYAFKGVSCRQPKTQPVIVMVHDVDHNINLCENLLLAEKDLGVGATYFLRLHAKAYNMLSRSSIEIARKIIDGGGSVGLHYEPTFCPTGIKYCDHIKTEMDINFFFGHYNG